MQTYLAHITEAARAFEALYRVARLLGDEREAAALAANEAVTPAAKVNLLQTLGFGYIEDTSA